MHEYMYVLCLAAVKPVIHFRCSKYERLEKLEGQSDYPLVLCVCCFLHFGNFRAIGWETEHERICFGGALYADGMKREKTTKERLTTSIIEFKFDGDLHNMKLVQH